MVERIIEKLKNGTIEDIKDDLYYLLKDAITSTISGSGKEMVNAYRILPSFIRFAKDEDVKDLVLVSLENIDKLVITERLRFLKLLWRGLYKPKPQKKAKKILPEL